MVNQSEMIIRFNEKRINGFTSHKSSYALICYISILFTKVSNDSKLKKYIIYFIIELSILLSNSMMGIAVSLITLLLFILMDFKNINKYIKIIIYSSIIPLIVLFGDKIYYYISKARDISTAGGRFYIWNSYIKLMLQNKLGIAKLTADKLIKSNEWDFYYYNAHNVFIQEFLERGIIGGILFVAIFIFFALNFIKIKRIDLFIGVIGIILICNMDYAIAKESIFFFWYLIILLYSKVRNDFYYK
ncbi:O-antigen ligase family protein [Clostridium perfringens]|uniref:O-antigen ligase family protein n=1 Tax=Clostridium perfringens TaxID=1502 RepID=UPI002B20680B|nr:O-antigen ligase family protein [Clostridium perfringens]MEA5271764.1 O-antigen ligase family protein [Clostridium perfringens]MEA5311205.1 O-antigen ligase family protein [Clostridium perfringens]MEA5341504.1 O-antigen ligase family protein [Clostridium perfringens]